MLSDTLSDNFDTDQTRRDIAHYRSNDDIYDYPDSLLDEILAICDRVDRIRVLLDAAVYP